MTPLSEQIQKELQRIRPYLSAKGLDVVLDCEDEGAVALRLIADQCRSVTDRRLAMLAIEMKLRAACQSMKSVEFRG